MSTELATKTDIDFPDVQALQKEAMALVIKTDQSFQAASELLISVRKTRRDLEAKQKDELSPLKSQEKTIKERYSVPFQILLQSESTLNKGVTAYHQAQEAERKRVQAIEDEKHRKATEKAITKAEAKGLEPVIPVAKVIQAPPKAVKSSAGSLGFRSVPKWRIPGVPEDEKTIKRDDPRGKSIPNQYFVLDVAQVGKLIRAGGKINGIEDYKVQTSNVR